MTREASRVMTDTVVRSCPVALLPSERHDYAVQLAQAVDQYEQLETTKKEETARLGRALKAQRARLDDLALKVNSGKEYRPIECSVLFDFHRSVVEVRRQDTDELVETRSMTKSEKEQRLQMTL